MKKYPSCTAEIGEHCSKHGVIHKAGQKVEVKKIKAYEGEMIERRLCAYCGKAYLSKDGLYCSDKCVDFANEEAFRRLLTAGTYNIENIRDEFSKLFKYIAWMEKRNVLAYDWQPAHSRIHLIAKLLRVSTVDGHIQKPDKRGTWR